jgi:hypothetical protein
MGILRNKVKRTIRKEENEFGEFSQEVDSLKSDLDELTMMLDTLKRYMVKMDTIEKKWDTTNERRR